MKTKISYLKIKGRESISIFLDNWFNNYIFTLLSQLFILLITPFFYLTSCSELNELETKTNLHIDLSKSSSFDTFDKGDTVDIFIYNKDEKKILDSYNRLIISKPLDNLLCTSRIGPKFIVIIQNPQHKDYMWEDIKDLESLSRLRMSLLNEKEEKKTAFCIQEINAGAIIEYWIETKPLTSSIRIKSIVCDFKDKVYNDSKLKDIKFYIINVNSSCNLLEKEENPSSIINNGEVIEEDMKMMLSPELLLKNYDKEVGSKVMYPDICLYTYPNEAKEESIGSEFTKLVIEGSIDGNTYYYPIDINRGDFIIKDSDGHIGIRKSYNYDLEITIKQCGMDSPHKSINKDYIELKTIIKKWKDIEEVTLNF